MRKPAMIVDSNERGVLCDSVLRKAEKAGLSVIRKPLVVGDYLLGEACVEAKSINDLFLSSHSGHLWATTGEHGYQLPTFLPSDTWWDRQVRGHGQEDWQESHIH